MSNTHIEHVGVIGMGVMGKNIALNIADHSIKVSIIDLDSVKVNAAIIQEQQEIAQYAPSLTPRLQAHQQLTDFVDALPSPRVIILSVPAGDAVDTLIEQLITLGITTKDIIIDTGNSEWQDSRQRYQRYQQQCSFFTCAISGGEEGARFGPSLMPSGDKVVWDIIAPIFTAIAAKIDTKTGQPLLRDQPQKPLTEGTPCTTYIGPIGSGHYVKMVHNGIEYADMQLICEVYDVLRQVLGYSATQISHVFAQWDQGRLHSYLMQISSDILAHIDSKTGKNTVDLVQDQAQQKGTGRWTAINSLTAGVPTPTITEAVFARSMTMLTTRTACQQAYPKTPLTVETEANTILAACEQALYLAKIVAYAQGFQLLQTQSENENWQLPLADIAKIWRGGCIIRAQILDPISQALAESQQPNLLLYSNFIVPINEAQQGLRQVLSIAIQHEVPTPALSSVLAYFDTLRQPQLPANLLQAQRDYFGGHLLVRTDDPYAKAQHIQWTK